MVEQIAQDRQQIRADRDLERFHAALGIVERGIKALLLERRRVGDPVRAR